MKILLLAILTLTMFSTVTAQSSEARLRGVVKDGKKTVSNLELVPSNGETTITNDKGEFSIKFDPKVKPGASTTLKVGGDWIIVKPFGGLFTTQNPKNQTRESVEVCRKLSTDCLSPDSMLQLAMELAKAQRKIGDLNVTIKQLGSQKKDLALKLERADGRNDDLEAQLRKFEIICTFAEQTGHACEVVAEALNRWANTKYKNYGESDEAYQQWVNRDWDKAALLAGASKWKKLDHAKVILNFGRQVSEASYQAARKIVQEAINLAMVEADSYREKGELNKAIKAYEELDKFFTPSEVIVILRDEWVQARTLLSIAKVAAAHFAKPSERVRLLAETISDGRDVSKLTKPHSLEWIAINGVLAHALFRSTEDQDESGRVRATTEAANILDSILTGIDKVDNTKCPTNCLRQIQVFNSLLAASVGASLENELGARLVKEGLKGLKTGMPASGIERSSPIWPEMQLSISSTFLNLGEAVPDKEGEDHLRTVVQLMTEVLSEPARLKHSLWAAHSVLGSAHMGLGRRQRGTVRLNHLRSALNHFERSLSNCTQTERCLFEQARYSAAVGFFLQVSEKKESEVRLRTFISLLEQALKTVPESSPEARQVTLTYYGQARSSLGVQLDGDESIVHLQAGIESIEQAIALTPSTDLQRRIETQLYLQTSLRQLGEKTTPGSVDAKLEANMSRLISILGDEKAGVQKRFMGWAQMAAAQELMSWAGLDDLNRASPRVRRAIDLYEAALKNISRSMSPQEWAGASAGLGQSIIFLRMSPGGEDATVDLNLAEQSLKRALTIYGPDNWPEESARVMIELAQLDFLLAEKLAADQRRQREQEAVDRLAQSCAVLSRDDSRLARAQCQASLGSFSAQLAERSDDPEKAQRVTTAIAALEEALSLLSPTEHRLLWARAMSDLAGALSLKGDHLSAISTCEKALTVFNGNNHRWHWGHLQARFGTALSMFAHEVQGEVGFAKLIASEEAFEKALNVFAETGAKSDWAQALSQLLTVKTVIASQLQGVEALTKADSVVKGYDSLLKASLPNSMEWAQAQLGLGHAFLVAGRLSPRSERLGKFQAATKSLNEAGSIFKHKTVEWARVQSEFGQVLLELGFLTRGKERESNLKAAASAVVDAVTVFQDMKFRGEWVDAKLTLSAVLFEQKLGKAAEESLKDVLIFDSRNRMALSALSGVQHELLMNYEEAYRSSQRIFELYPDVYSHAELIEATFTAAQFAECERLLSNLLVQPELDVRVRMPMSLIEIANAAALEKVQSIGPMLDSLIQQVNDQPPDFELNWHFDGTINFIKREKRLSRQKNWLVTLLSAANENNRELLLQALKKVRSGVFKAGARR